MQCAAISICIHQISFSTIKIFLIIGFFFKLYRLTITFPLYLKAHYNRKPAYKSQFSVYHYTNGKSFQLYCLFKLHTEFTEQNAS